MGRLSGQTYDGGIQRSGKPKARPQRAHEFTEEKQRRFLDALAATANADAAAQAAGVAVSTPYRLRQRAPEFAAAWDAALEIGYLRLEEQLLARALEAVDAMTIDPTTVAVPPLPSLADACAQAGHGPGENTGSASARGPGGDRDAAGGGATGWASKGLPPAYQLALALLNRRNHLLRGGGGRRPGGGRKAKSGDEITAMLLKRLDMAATIADARAASAAISAEPAMPPTGPMPPGPTLPGPMAAGPTAADRR